MPALELWPCLNHFCLFSRSFVNFLDSNVLLGPNSGNFMCWYRTEFFSLVMHIYVLISSRIRATTKDPLSVNTMCDTWLARSSCLFVRLFVLIWWLARWWLNAAYTRWAPSVLARSKESSTFENNSRSRGPSKWNQGMESSAWLWWKLSMLVWHATSTGQWAACPLVMLRKLWIREFRKLSVLY